MTSLNFYFPAHLDADPRAVRKRLNALAASLGYVATATHSPKPGSGSAAALLVALARGEVEIKHKHKQEKTHVNY